MKRTPSGPAWLDERIQRGEVIILDGATGTELVDDINPANSSNPDNIVDAGGANTLSVFGTTHATVEGFGGFSGVFAGAGELVHLDGDPPEPGAGGGGGGSGSGYSYGGGGGGRLLGLWGGARGARGPPRGRPEVCRVPPPRGGGGARAVWDGRWWSLGGGIRRPWGSTASSSEVGRSQCSASSSNVSNWASAAASPGTGPASAAASAASAGGSPTASLREVWSACPDASLREVWSACPAASLRDVMRQC